MNGRGVARSLRYSDLGRWDALVISQYGGYPLAHISPYIWNDKGWFQKHKVMAHIQIANANATKYLMGLYMSDPS